MQLNVQSTYSIPQPKEILEFELELISSGVRFKAKSEPLHAYISSLPKMEVEKKFSPVWKDFGLVPRKLSSLPNFFANYVSYGWFDLNDKPNLVWLCSSKLGEGFEVVVPVPMSLSNMTDFFNGVQDSVASFYTTYVRGVKLTTRLTDLP